MSTFIANRLANAQLLDPKLDVASKTADIQTSVKLPNGFPAKIDTAMAWSREQVALSSFVVRLTAANVREIEGALEEFKDLGLDGSGISTETFVLPTLGNALANLSMNVHEGKGLGLVRGLDVTKYTVEDLTMIYLGIQSYIADCRGRQDDKGNMLVHIVADGSSAVKSEHHRHSTHEITFHNEEAGDITSWFCRGVAESGGHSVIASVYKIFNVLAATRPDIIRTLVSPDWPFAMPEVHYRPILYFHDGKLIMNFGRIPLIGNATHPRPAHLPKLTPRQLEALDVVEKTARANELAVATQSGDVFFINNLAVLHRRDGFVNGTDTDHKRHLVRMRLRSSVHGWAIPTEIAPEWVKAFDGAAEQVWHLDPMPAGYFPIRMFPN